MTLGVLTVLTLLAINLGHDVSLGLRVDRYYRDKLKAQAMTKAGFLLATEELKKDQNDYDALPETWSTGLDPLTGRLLFDKMEVRRGSGETFSVGSMLSGDDSVCMVDEERKININTASLNLLAALFESAGAMDPKALAQGVLSFRAEAMGSTRQDRKNFMNTQELILIDGMTEDLIRRIEGMVTVYGDGMVNINTVSESTLGILLKGVARDMSVKDDVAESLATKIIQHRKASHIYTSRSDMDIELQGADETNVYNDLFNRIVFQSDYFLIETVGEVRGIKAYSAAVYEKQKGKIVSWYEE